MAELYQEPSARYGWIDVSGRFFPCASVCHYELAVRLCEDNGYEFPGDAMQVLIDRGWAKVWNPGITVKRTLLDVQRETAEKIYWAFADAVERGENVETLVNANPEGYSSGGQMRLSHSWGTHTLSMMAEDLGLGVEPHALITPPYPLANNQSPTEEKP